MRRGGCGIPFLFVLWSCPLLAGDPDTFPNDPQFPLQWGMHNSGQLIAGEPAAGLPGADVDALGAWRVFPGAANVTVAIIGRGVDPHPEFADRLLEGRSFVGDLYDTLDSCAHDTHLAGIIAARRDNQIGVAGLIDRAFLLPVRTLDGCGGSSEATAEGIVWAVDQGAHVILAAVQFTEWSDALADGVRYAVDRDVLVIAPAGSAGADHVSFPAALEGCLAVSATDQRDDWSDVSNRGPEVELSAPGHAIWSTWVGETYGFQVEGRDTASAAAFVTGVAALVRSFNPELSAEQVRLILTITSDDLGVGGRDPLFGFGRVNAARALAGAPQPLIRFEHLLPLPPFLPPVVGSTLPIRIASSEEDVQVAHLVYSADGLSFELVPMQRTGRDIWSIRYPAFSCGTEVSYFFTAIDSSGVTHTDPLDAPNSLHNASVAFDMAAFEDDFERDLGWLVEGGDNTNGRWARVEPVGTVAQPEYDRSPDAGEMCFVTGQHFGGDPGTNDVDEGPWRLTSPLVEVNGYDAVIEYARWFYWDGAGVEDFLVAELSKDGGASWTLLETVSATGGWQKRSFQLSEVWPEPVQALQLRFSAADQPNDSLTEAGIDDVTLRTRRCAISPGDLNENGVLDSSDLAGMIECWSPSWEIAEGACRVFDFDYNFRVDLADFQAFQAGYGK